MQKHAITYNNTIAIHCYLASCQLTWQVVNGWFLPVFDDFFMEFINIRPAYIRGWVVGWVGGGGGCRGKVGGGKSLNKEERRHK